MVGVCVAGGGGGGGSGAGSMWWQQQWWLYVVMVAAVGVLRGVVAVELCVVEVVLLYLCVHGGCG